MKILILVLLVHIGLQAQTLVDSFRIIYDKDYYMLVEEFDRNYLEGIPGGTICITESGDSKIKLKDNTEKQDHIDEIEEKYAMDSLKIKAKIDSIGDPILKEKKLKELDEYKINYPKKMNKLKMINYIYIQKKLLKTRN